MTRKILATATFKDAYGQYEVRLVPVGREGRANWEGVDRCATCGYRNAPAVRLIAAARRDRRFSNVAA